MARAAAKFDFIVIGAGAAGCVVAARLARATSASVLLLEAGPDLRADPPPDIRDGWHITRTFDWGDTAQPNELGASVPVRRVKVVGGTSSVTRFAMRGSPEDYDEWEALGNPGWGWQEVLPAFRTLEADVDFGDRPWHGGDGPIPVTRYHDLDATEPHAALVRALEASGFASVEDHNEPGAVGVGRMPMSGRDGVRVTTASAFLPVGGEPPNLAIRPDTIVASVTFDGQRASGVRLANGEQIAASAVILCAGVYGSPAILMRSGIGPAAHLRDMGIRVIVDLPGVGSNLVDHPATDLDLGYGGSARASPLLHSAATFHSANASTSGPPDLMFWIADPAPLEDPHLSIDVVLLKPRSRGSVRLRSADPGELPVVDLPNLRDPGDVERLAEAYRRAADVAGDPGVRRFCTVALPPREPDDAELRHNIGSNTYSVPHVVGTCAMGAAAADGAVVDAAAAVHGTERLFVADASVMPTIPSGFTHLPTIMIAERVSAFLTDPTGVGKYGGRHD